MNDGAPPGAQAFSNRAVKIGSDGCNPGEEGGKRRHAGDNDGAV